MTTRPASVADALAIATVQVASWQAAYRHLLPAEWLQAMSVDELQAQWQQIMAQGRSAVTVAIADEQVIGFASSGPSRDKDATPDTYELFALYVHPAHWAGQHGWQLWQSVRQSAVQARAAKCRLWVIVGNVRGIGFYERVGFQCEAGSRQNFDIDGVPLQEDRFVLLLAQDLAPTSA